LIEDVYGLIETEGLAAGILSVIIIVFVLSPVTVWAIKRCCWAQGGERKRVLEGDDQRLGARLDALRT